ncbi:hypothetical protein FRC07_004577 [Ceratobasidium sp. 392]|nr:hypothetical protein FRC07_004577 [Ceratobasidium sp. 392]
MASLNSAALSSLRSALSSTATVNLPGDAEYTNKRWAGNAEKTAAIVVCPATAEDVVQILAFVQGKAPYESQGGIDFAVKGGGHSPSGASSVEGGLVIDLQPKMHNVKVDPSAKLAYVGGGSLWADVDEAAVKHGLAPVAGVVSHTGVGGLTLGGGFGWLCGQHGLVIDNLVGATVVTASGDIVSTSETENPELLWALRGGGGNFGVVTEFVFRLHEQRPDLYQALMMFPPPVMEPLVSEVNAWLADRTIIETGALVFVIGPGGQPVLGLYLLYNGDSAEGKSKFERFVKIGPVVHQDQTIPYIQLNQLLNPSSTHGDSRHSRGNFVPTVETGVPIDLVKAVYDEWFKSMQEYPEAAKSIVVWELYSPEVWSKTPSNATAYVHRKPAYNMNTLTRWSDPSFESQALTISRAIDEVFVKTRAKHFAPELVGEGGYTNYLDEDASKKSQEVAHKRFGSNYPRLVEVKTKYDPENKFGKWFPIIPK